VVCNPSGIYEVYKLTPQFALYTQIADNIMTAMQLLSETEKDL